MANVSVSGGSKVEVKSMYQVTSTLAQWSKSGQGKISSSVDFIDILKLRTVAQSVNCFGFGNIVNGVDIRGVLKLVIKDSTGAVIPGTIRLYQTGAKQFGGTPIMEDRTELMSSAGRSDGFRLEEKQPGAREDSYLIIAFQADVSGKTIDLDKSEGLIPITCYDI